MKAEVIEKIYAGWLAKIIGIRYGAPIEGWTYEKIKNIYGELDHYPVDYHEFAADDDSNGPLFFLKALEDGRHGYELPRRDEDLCYPGGTRAARNRRQREDFGSGRRPAFARYRQKDSGRDDLPGTGENHRDPRNPLDQLREIIRSRTLLPGYCCSLTFTSFHLQDIQAKAVIHLFTPTSSLRREGAFFA